MIKLPAATPAQRVGPLVVNPGGPGGSGVQYALEARSEFPAALRARFDIVGFDPRGVAGSEPALACLTGPELDTYLATDDMPDTPPNWPGSSRRPSSTRNGASRTPARCCRTSAPRTRPATWTCSAPRSARPGSPTWASPTAPTWAPGTPSCSRTGCRALVLDGAVDPDTPALQDDITQAEGFQVAFRSFATWCLAAPGCPLGEGAAPVAEYRGSQAASPDRSG